VLRRAYASGYRHGQYFGPGWSSTLDQRLLPVAGARWPLSWDRRIDAVTILDPATGHTRHFSPPPGAAEAAPGGGAHEVRHLTRITDRNGNWLTITRDADGVPVQVDHSGGYRITIDSSYCGGGFRLERLRMADPAHPGGVSLAWYGYDPAGRLIEIGRGEDAPLVYEYDHENRIAAWIDQSGYRFDYVYDASGRTVRVGGADGTLAATFTYDLEARCTRVIDSLQAITAYWYDEQNHLLKTVDPLGGTIRMRHDPHGRLLEHTDQLGNTTRFERDAFGNVLEVLRPDGSRSVTAYNALQQPVHVTAPGGGVRTFAYDERGNLTAATDPNGAVTKYAYDGHGGVISTTDPDGNTATVQVNRGRPADFDH
jgi:YD repeat-containing protein